MLVFSDATSEMGLDLGPAMSPVVKVSALLGMILMINGCPLNESSFCGGESFDCINHAFAPKGLIG